jgi:predicted nucleotidyltransferase
MNHKIMEQLRIQKNNLLPKGFIVLGIFGSIARNEETPESDIDILYELNQQFYSSYNGWEAITAIQEIKIELENYFQKKLI